MIEFIKLYFTQMDTFLIGTIYIALIATIGITIKLLIDTMKY